MIVLATKIIEQYVWKWACAKKRVIIATKFTNNEILILYWIMEGSETVVLSIKILILLNAKNLMEKYY